MKVEVVMFSAVHREWPRPNGRLCFVGTQRTLRAFTAFGATAMFSAFYRRYVAACTELVITPLTTEQLRALIAALLERSAAHLH